MAGTTKPSRRRTASGPPADDPVTGVPGTEDGPPDNWRGEHGHAHDEDMMEHSHQEGQTDEDTAADHIALSFDEGPGPTDQLLSKARPRRKRSATGKTTKRQSTAR